MLTLTLRALFNICLISAFIGSGWTIAHPYHNSFTEISWKESANKPLTGTLQVALRVIPEDLESILSTHENHPLVLDDSQQTDEAIVRYLWQFFRVRNETGQQLTMNWVGKEVEHRGAWLYFEYNISNLQNLTLENRVLMDFKENQTNRVNISIRGQTKNYIFTLQENKPKLIWRK